MINARCEIGLELNLEKDILEGWEHFYDNLNVEVLRIARRLDHKFPPVDIVREEKGYRLAFGRDYDGEWNNYGGHSRSVLAFQDKYLLSCRVLPDHRKNPKDHKDTQYYPVLNIQFCAIQNMRSKRITTADSLTRLNENLQFLPIKLREKFIEENSLIVLENGDLIDKEDYLNPHPF